MKLIISISTLFLLTGCFNLLIETTDVRGYVSIEQQKFAKSSNPSQNAVTKVTGAKVCYQQEDLDCDDAAYYGKKPDERLHIYFPSSINRGSDVLATEVIDELDTLYIEYKRPSRKAVRGEVRAQPLPSLNLSGVQFTPNNTLAIVNLSNEAFNLVDVVFDIGGDCDGTLLKSQFSFRKISKRDFELEYYGDSFNWPLNCFVKVIGYWEVYEVKGFESPHDGIIVLDYKEDTLINAKFD